MELAVEPGIGPEGFQIIDGRPSATAAGGKDALCIVGNDERGLLYGVGKFLRTSRYDRGGLSPGIWRGASVPEKPVRGIYFATHFHNFYHEAPVEEVRRYVEDLGLWGFNTIVVWYDMYHFRGFTDPKAVEFRRRLRAVFETARGIGLSAGLGTVANEGYGNSPRHFRADIGGMRGAKRPTDVCPGKARRTAVHPAELRATLRRLRRSRAGIRLDLALRLGRVWLPPVCPMGQQRFSVHGGTARPAGEKIVPRRENSPLHLVHDPRRMAGPAPGF